MNNCIRCGSKFPEGKDWIIKEIPKGVSQRFCCNLCAKEYAEDFMESFMEEMFE